MIFIVKEKKLDFVLYALVILVIISKIILGYHLGDSFFDRGNSHTPLFMLAENLYKYHTFSIEYPIRSIDYEPGYPYLIFLGFKLFGYNWFGLTCIQAILMGFSGIMFYRISKFYVPALISLIASAYFLFYPYLFFYSLSVYDTIPFTFLLILLVYILHRYYTGKSKILYNIMLGVVLGLGFLLRGAIITLIPPLFIYFIYLYYLKERQLKQLIISSLLIFIPMLLVIAPWLIRNYKLTGHAIVSTHGSFGVWQGNNPKTYDFLKKNISLDEVCRTEPIPEIYQKYPKQARTPKEAFFVSKQYSEEAKEFIFKNKMEFIKLSFLKFIKLWSWNRNPNSSDAIYSSNNTRQVIHLIGYLPLLILFPFGIVFLYNKNRLFFIFFISLFVFYTLAHMIAMGFTRARIPLDPILMMLFEMGLYQINFIFNNTKKHIG